MPTAPPGQKQTGRDELAETILDRQLKDGGWAYSGDKAQADMTAMAIQALAPYYNESGEVKNALDKAVTLLSQLQGSTGGYTSGGTLNVESAAQVIIALTALGIDPYSDSRFIKNGASVLDSLCSFYVEGEGFSHSSGGTTDELATAQAYCALCAYYRYTDARPGLYDMKDVQGLK